jgi:SAM-dependent methyltransferase
MDDPPRDPDARREWLEHWVEEQAEKGQLHQAAPPLRLRTRLRLAADRLRRAPGRASARLKQWCQSVVGLVLDRGLDTSGQAVEPEHDHPDRVRYLPSDWHVLPRALRYLGVSDRDTFVDFGCGKGRVVHQAARRPFRRVIGVEISPVLAEIARNNLAARGHQHQCSAVEIVVADAAEYRVPDDLTIAYFDQPFTAETFDAVLRNIIDSIDRRPRRVRLIYVCPQDRAQVLATGRFRLLKKQRSRLLDTPLSRAEIFESV